MFSAKAFSIIELYGNGKGTRNIHDTTNYFYCETMKLQTPLKSLPVVVDIINSMKKITPEGHQRQLLELSVKLPMQFYQIIKIF